MFNFCDTSAHLSLNSVLFNCMNKPQHDWSTSLWLPPPVSCILCGLMRCFPWKLGLWFIDWASDRVCTRELRVCFHTQPLEWCRGTVSNSDKESEMWRLTSQGVRQGAFIIPEVSCSPRRRRWMEWNRVAEQSLIFQKNAGNSVLSESESWKEEAFVFLKHHFSNAVM